MTVFEHIGGTKESEAAEVQRRMELEGHFPDGYVWTGEVVYTDVEGMDVPEDRLVMDEEDDLDDWITAWFRFTLGGDKAASDGIVVRVDDDKFHAMADEEWGWGDDDQSSL